jgi:hypothetical protein
VACLLWHNYQIHKSVNWNKDSFEEIKHEMVHVFDLYSPTCFIPSSIFTFNGLPISKILKQKSPKKGGLNYLPTVRRGI